MQPDTMLDAIEAHLLMLHHLLVFDAWQDLLRSPTGRMLQSSLSVSEIAQEVQLGAQLVECSRSLPSNTHDWMRLFISAVTELDQIGVLICDATLASCPIVFANAGFEGMTGYLREDVVGASCRFLQGPKSDPSSISTIRTAMQTGTQTHVRLFNYRKNGSIFLNMISFRPIYDSIGGYCFMVSISAEVWAGSRGRSTTRRGRADQPSTAPPARPTACCGNFPLLPLTPSLLRH